MIVVECTFFIVTLVSTQIEKEDHTVPHFQDLVNGKVDLVV